METPSVRNLHQELTRKMKALDDKLMEEYEPNIRKIEQIRFDFFKQCVLDSKDTPQCFKKSQEYELRPRFEKWGGELQQCVNKAVFAKNWMGAGDACLSVYEKGLRGDIQGQIKRVLSNIKI